MNAIEFLRRENIKNPMFWRMDAINYLLESEYFPVLVDMIIGFAMSHEKEISSGLASNNSFPVITDTDIFRSKAVDLLGWILSDAKKYFSEKEDWRSYYRMYLGLYKNGADIEEIKKEFNENGMVFNPKMFEEE